MSSPITTHILDTHLGIPAQDVSIELFRKEEDGYTLLAQGRTDDDGRIRDLLPEGSLSSGVYQMRFAVEEYHQRNGIEGFYPEAVITFIVRNVDQHYHIPLLLSPFAYSTYRGS